MGDSISSLMLYNLSQSMIPIQSLVTGIGYFFGIAMFVKGLEKLRSIGDFRAQSHSQEKMFVVVAYFMGGAALIYSPSMVPVLANTLFGQGNVLQYSATGSTSIISSMKIIIQTAGVIWFVRGIALMVQASEPGGQEGSKGLAYIVGGVLSIYIDDTMSWLNDVITYVTAHL